jgi:hypothetical protein
MIQQPDRQLQFLQELAAGHATIAGDVVEVDTRTWAIHGSIAVDGEVLMAEYDTRELAQRALQQLPAAEPRPAAPWKRFT